MTETTVGTDLLQALEIITELGVDTVGEDLGVLAIDNVALSVEEPLFMLLACYSVAGGHRGMTYGGDLVGGGILDDGDQTLELFGGELTGALLQVDIGLLAHQVGVAATDTLDLAGLGVSQCPSGLRLVRFELTSRSKRLSACRQRWC